MSNEMPKDIAAELRVRAAIEQIPGTLFDRAANEIERLREELTASHESHGNEVGALTERLSLAIHERDEARRMCCEQAAMDESGYVKHGDMLHFAESRGWDCFKGDGK